MRIKVEQVISLKEARKLLGEDGKELADEDVEEIIENFDIIAQYMIKLVPTEKKTLVPTD